MQTSPQFEACLPFTLTEEGGNSNDPHDPGGRTHKGIIQREYDRYRRGKGLSLRSDYLMSDDEVREIYWTEYWLPHCPDLPVGMDLSFFDNCVNEGQLRAIVLLQRALAVHDDGQWGPVTTDAVQTLEAAGNIVTSITRYSQAREHFYRSLGTFKFFGKGWLSRVGHINQASLVMARKAAP